MGHLVLSNRDLHFLHVKAVYVHMFRVILTIRDPQPLASASIVRESGRNACLQISERAEEVLHMGRTLSKPTRWTVDKLVLNLFVTNHDKLVSNAFGPQYTLAQRDKSQPANV